MAEKCKRCKGKGWELYQVSVTNALIAKGRASLPSRRGLTDTLIVKLPKNTKKRF